MNTGYLRVFALFYFVNWDDVYNSLPSVWEAGKMSCFVGSGSEAHLFQWCCFTWHVGVAFVLRILSVTEFSKVRKSSAQRKIVKVLSQWTLKYNITGRDLSGLCDFLHMEGKFVENVSVVIGWKVWLFVEVTSTSDILIISSEKSERLLKAGLCVKRDWQPVLEDYIWK